MPRCYKMHLARRLMGQTESKTCIGKGMKHPRHIRLLPIQDAEAPKRHFRRSHPDRCSWLLALRLSVLPPAMQRRAFEAMLWEAIGPLPDSSEQHEGGLDRPQSFSANRDRQGRPRQYRASGSPIHDRSSAQDQCPERSSVARTRPSPGFFSRSDRTIFFPDGCLYQYAYRRAVRLSALRFGTRRSAEAATLQLPQFKGAPDWALFCDHYVGTKKWSKT